MGFLEHILDRIEGKAERGQKRSPEWRKVKNAYLLKNPNCEACGKSKGVQVHHKVPFNIAPDLELDPNNLISLCTKGKTLNCHIIVGHLGNFRATNPNVELDAIIMRKKLEDGRSQTRKKTK